MDWINTQRGGVSVGGIKRQVQLTVVDDGWDPEGAVNATKYLVESFFSFVSICFLLFIFIHIYRTYIHYYHRF